jgi:hypothetical protein
MRFRAQPNVFLGAVGYGPDWPQTSGEPITDCNARQIKNFRKTYEIGEPNFEAWHPFQPDANVFPNTVGKSGPDAPHPFSQDDDVKLFDGHGGIIGLEVFLSQCVSAFLSAPSKDAVFSQDSMKWSDTPGSAAPKVYGKYANGGTTGMDTNVFAGGYKFPEY